MIPDLEQARRYLDVLDPEAEIFTFQTFTDSHPKPKPDPLARVRSGSFESLHPWLESQNRLGAGVFVTVNETDGTGRTADKITRIRALWQEDDDKGKGAPLPIEPHIEVESSPGKTHRYILCDGITREDFPGLQSRMVADYGSDPDAADLARVLRVPGFYHRKAEPHMVRLLKADRLSQPYTREAVLAKIKPLEKAPRKQTGRIVESATETVTDEQVRELRSALAFIRPDGRTDWIVQGARLRALGEVGRGLWLEWSKESDKWRPEDAREWDTIGHDNTGYKAIFKEAQGRGWPNPMAGTKAPRVTSTAPIITSAADLLQREFQPVQWAVQGILPEGITILSGDPKIGKSWLLYQACVAVATGKPLWRGREPEIQGDTLLLALEDNDRRMQRRLHTLLPRFATMSGTKFNYPDVSQLHYSTQWPRAEEGVKHIAQWLREHPGARMVVIDTVSAFRDPEPGRKSAYATDYAVGEMLKPLAKEFSCAIVLVMHNRKAASDDPLQMVSGTQGMTGGVDNVLVMKRERGNMDAGLYVDGRDIEEPQEIAMRFDNGYWSSDGQSVAEVQVSRERKQLIEVVSRLGDDARVRAIQAELHNKKPASVRSLLSKMVKGGDLSLNDGLYTLLGTVGTVGTAEAA